MKARRSTSPKHKLYRAEGPVDGRFTKELFRGPRVRHPYPVGTLRSRACELAVNFVWSLIKRDLSPWWFWPSGIVAVFVLKIAAGNLLRLAKEND
jgi:hypothetical protein